ncbi:hypothetical protein [Nakamurella leprariae]|uniref:hypothetical protein n=1 Tax=Nakamurella leprariae TaxID=2803911 RepID=UPI00196349AB|nr:hypothetical protein [Nakamurella leprariae]
MVLALPSAIEPVDGDEVSEESLAGVSGGGVLDWFVHLGADDVAPPASPTGRLRLRPI